MTLSLATLSCPLPHLGVIQAQGDDAASFLHNQLTQDVLLLNEHGARLAAWCNPKGRMLASFVLCKPQPDQVLLICQRDVLPQTLKRLSMFVMRSKVKLSDASDAFHVHGLMGDALRTLTEEASPWRRIAPDMQTQLLTLYPALGQPRALWLAPIDVTPPAATPSDDDTQALWAYAEVMSGVAWVGAATAEAFVPQMLNYESVDGVNFKKGCYPGQEVVARSQFRGTLKRRAFIVASPQSLHAGQEVFSSTDPTQPCGLIAQAASVRDQHVAIAELQITATAGTLHLGQADGPVLHLQSLPYALREDI